MIVGDCVEHSDDRKVEFKIFSEIRIKDNKVATLAFRGASFELFREIFSEAFSLFKAGQSVRNIFHKFRSRQFWGVLSQASGAEDLPGGGSPAD